MLINRTLFQNTDAYRDNVCVHLIFNLFHITEASKGYGVCTHLISNLFYMIFKHIGNTVCLYLTTHLLHIIDHHRYQVPRRQLLAVMFLHKSWSLIFSMNSAGDFCVVPLQQTIFFFLSCSSLPLFPFLFPVLCFHALFFSLHVQ